jgi:Transglycosylase SLT domain
MPSRCKRQLNLTTLIVSFMGTFSATPVFAQMVTCTTEDGISFTTTVSERYSLAVVSCHTADQNVDAELSSPEKGVDLKYADQMQLYNEAQPDIILPTQPIRRRQRLDSITVSNESYAGNDYPSQSVLPFHDIMSSVGQQHNIDPLFLQAIAKAESSHNRFAISPVGARGLMQLMPATARRYAKFSDVSVLNDPHTNVSISAAYLKSLQSRYGNNLQLILAAYNAGEGAVAKYGNTIPPYRETQNYVVKVLGYYNKFRTRK